MKRGGMMGAGSCTVCGGMLALLAMGRPRGLGVGWVRGCRWLFAASGGVLTLRLRLVEAKSGSSPG